MQVLSAGRESFYNEPAVGWNVRAGAELGAVWVKIAAGHEIKHKADLSNVNAGDVAIGLPVSTKLMAMIPIYS